MDIISFNEAATANGRIEKFIKNPDSTSGIVTVPKVIGAGENITIPSGRMAVLPNVQVDGILNVEGEVFIPSGAGLSTVVQKSGDTMTGNLNFASGTKITGDFSNATVANRVAFQNSNLNANTNIPIIPNGTGFGSQHWYYNSSDMLNASRARVGLTSTNELWIMADIVGTASYAPIVMSTGGSERMRIDTAGNVGIGTSSPDSLKGKSVHIYNNTVTGTVTDNTSLILESANRNSAISCRSNGNGSIQLVNLSGTPITQMNLQPDGSFVQVIGNGLGYGTGGTVTQSTNKFTAVTLNKPSGRITTNNASLAYGGLAWFFVNNTCVTPFDTIVTNVTGGTADCTAYMTYVFPTIGGFYVTIKNNSVGGNALADAIQIQFNVVKGATA